MNLGMLDNINGFQIKQSRQWLESFTGFEASNSYAITDENGNPIFAAKEEGGNIFARWILNNKRPFKMNLYLPSGEKALHFERSFAFIKHTMSVQEGSGREIGKVNWSFSVVRKKFVVLGSDGQQRYKMQTSPLSPWTFTLKNSYDQKVGTMAKKWSGLGLEMFTTSDNFGLVLDVDIPSEDKALLLGAVILADFIHFEDKD